MTKTIIIVIQLLFISYFNAQNLQVVGRYLKDANNNNVILRGINYPMIDEYDIPLNNTALVNARIDDLSQTGANCMRFSWYTNGTHYKDFVGAGASYGPGTLNGYIQNGHLNSLIQYARKKGMITVLEIHNFTGSTDYVAFQNVVTAFWTSPAIVALINANEKHFIINIANEFGTGGSGTALDAFKNNYITTIQAIRATGVKVPIMIDAQNYGAYSSQLVPIAAALLAADPLNNVMFSAHAYWDGYATTLTQVQTKLNEMQNSNTCFILGEVANKQAGAPSYCGEINISALYPIILAEACTRDIGWLAWDYHQDCEPTREMTSTGLFANLTPWGNDVVNNANYGLKSLTACGVTALPAWNAGLESLENKQFVISPNPANNEIQVIGKASDKLTLEMFDLSGKTILVANIENQDKIDVSVFKAGTYTLRITNGNTVEHQKLIIL